VTADLAQHQRDRIRKLEQRLDGLTRYRDQLERAYALACIALAGTNADPAQVAAVIHELAEASTPVIEEAA
jgi:hypothetical protein